MQKRKGKGKKKKSTSRGEKSADFKMFIHSIQIKIFPDITKFLKKMKRKHRKKTCFVFYIYFFCIITSL